MSDRILSTVHYNMFELNEVNREVDVDSRKFKNLVESMKKYGFKSSHPLDVVEDKKGKLRIRCGHNRLTAAQYLGIPVKYVISTDNSTIYELENAGPGGWKSEHYLDSFCKQGYASYQMVKDYMKETGIGLANAASMFFGESAGSGNYLKYGKFQSGKFEIRTLKHPLDVKEIVLFLKGEPVKIEWASSNYFVKALSRVLWLEEFRKQRFIDKARTFPQLFKKQKGLDDYLRHIEEIYNYKSLRNEKVNIEFLANQAAMDRHRLGLRIKK